MSSMEKKRADENIRNAGIAGASAEVVQRYGSAVKEHIVAYSGKDNETGIRLKKSLKSISKEKVNPDYRNQNLKQQAGFSAEVKETARANAKLITAGKTIRKIRTDDLGRVNDPIFDHVVVDRSGNIITGSGSQMKFVGRDPREALEKLASKKFSKYLEQDAIIEVPSDYYEGILREADTKIASLQRQLGSKLENGDMATAGNLKGRIAVYQKIKQNLQKSNVSTAGAMRARLHPEISTAIDIAKLSHQAGVETVKTSVVIGGSISIVQNLVSVAKRDIGVDEAASNVAKDTATSVAVGYGTGFAGASIKGAMQNAGSETVRALSKTNLPGIIVSVTASAAKSLSRYFKGEISGLACFEELGEQGIGMVSSALSASIGQAVIPFPVVGGLIGGMLGYAIASASYGALLQSLKYQRYAREERIEIEAVCEKHIEMIRAYRAELEETIRTYLISRAELFHDSFDGIKRSLSIGDVDGVIAGTNQICLASGRTPQFKNAADLDLFMHSREPFKL